MNPQRTASDTAWLHDAVERYESPLIRYIVRMTGELETARDIVQDTFLKLCQQDRDQVEPILPQWLYRVCRNRALDVLKKEKRVNQLSDQQAESCRSREADQGAALERQEDAASAVAMLDTLPDRQRELIRLKIEGGLSYRQISEVTGLSVSNVGYILHMGFKALREGLRQRLEAAGGA